MVSARRPPRNLLKRLRAAAAVLLVLAASGTAIALLQRPPQPPSFRAQACGLPSAWLERIRRGFFAPRSGHIAILPRTPAYMATGAGGWSHSGPWEYLQEVPLVFYGPGIIDGQGLVDREATLADVAPTIVTLLHGAMGGAGKALPEVATVGSSLGTNRPRLVVTVVWDGGGWNTLERWPGAWPVLARLVEEGVAYRATVGSSPSVTPAVHTTIGTGRWPAEHGITGVPVRDEHGDVVDSFLDGESTRFLLVPTIAELWDESHDNDPLVGMVGYEPWHLGMIGKGAERSGGDRDHAAWLDTETNEWITNAAHYSLPQSLLLGTGLERGLAELDAADGRTDGAWRDNPILDDPARIEETPAFVDHHARSLMNLVAREGYGADSTTDLLFTNFKQIDRVGHYFNMASPEVRDVLEATDDALGRLVRFLDSKVGRRRWVLIVTADHGQQPDAAEVHGYGADPNEIERDIDDRFGPITRAVWPTEIFLRDEALRREGVTVDEVARWLSGYTIAENAPEGPTGRLAASDRLFELAIPSRLLASIDCGA